MAHAMFTPNWSKPCCGIALAALPAHPGRLHSPYGPVSPGADGPQRRVSQRDVPRRLLHLQPVEARSDGGLHGPVAAVCLRDTVGLAPSQVKSGHKTRTQVSGEERGDTPTLSTRLPRVM